MVQIERVGPDDWRTVREVRLAALGESPDYFWATYDQEVGKPEAWWRDFIGSGGWFLALQDGAPVGIAAAIPDHYLRGTERQLISMWVAPAARSRGIARMLIERVKEWARAESIAELRLDVTDGNDRALRLYQSCGFELTGRTTPHPRAPRLVENEMRLRL